MKSIYLIPAVMLFCLPGFAGETPVPVPYGPVPSARQLEWQRHEVIGMVSFSLNTWTGKDPGYGDEDVKLFNPTQFDAGQIVQVAKSADMETLVFTCKHAVGLCLWPSRYNDSYTVKNSPWRDGKGDMVREFVDACRAGGLGVGLYITPWDRHRGDYGQPSYVEYYHNLLRELLSSYGPAAEVWFDGGNKGTGYYGGARENRVIDPKTYYQWDKITAIVRKLQPAAACFGLQDVRWVGNEDGVAGNPCWSTINDLRDTNAKRLNRGERNGTNWMAAEADFPLRDAWFWHPNDQPKSAADLVDLYFTSVGRNAVMDIGIAPDQHGLVCAEDAAVLKGFGERIRAIFAHNLALAAKVTASNVRGNDPTYAAANILQGYQRGNYWATDDAVTTPEVTLDFGQPVAFSVISLRERIQLGQRVNAWALDAWRDGKWNEFAKGTCISAHHLWRGKPLTASRLRLRITSAVACPALSEFGVYLEPEASRQESLSLQGVKP